MPLAIIVLGLLTFAFFLFAVAMLARVFRSVPPAEIGEEDLDASRYRPMDRLLSGEDERYLKAQGVSGRGLRQFRAQRRRTFRMYLNSLSTDFSRVTRAMKLALVGSQQENPELEKALLRAQATFVYALAMVEFRLALHALGARSIAMDMKPLIAALEQMCEQFEIRPEFSGAAA